MKSLAQRGFTLPEVLAALAVAGLVIGLAGEFAGVRIDAEKTRMQRVERQYVASLVERAHRQGLLADDAATAADLQAALPQVVVPARLDGGQTYRIAFDGDDPRLLVDVKTGSHEDAAIQTEVARVPFPASELRIPLWRARRLRQIQEEAE